MSYSDYILNEMHERGKAESSVEVRQDQSASAAKRIVASLTLLGVAWMLWVLFAG